MTIHVLALQEKQTFIKFISISKAQYMQTLITAIGFCISFEKHGSELWPLSQFSFAELF